MLVLGVGEIEFPFVAFFEGDIAFEDFFDFGAEFDEVEVPPGGEGIVEGMIFWVQIGYYAVAGFFMELVTSLARGGKFSISSVAAS